ncbi:MAG: ATP-binding protein, partial [Tannerellaceae bacterium]
VRVAIYHIFSNAIKYIQDKTTLLVEIEERNNQTCVSFNMRSLHICIDEKERIFEDHYSGKSTKAKNKNGNGLGMGLIRKALKINNATIEVICGQKISKQAGQDFSDNIFKLTFLTA